MDHFKYRKDVLHAEKVSLQALADTFGTPLYCMSQSTLERHYRVLNSALAGIPRRRICYAVKANPSLAVLRVLARMGAGADVVSEGELRLALAAGIPPGDIAFSGPGKSRHELEFAIEAGVGLVNVESRQELALLSEVALAKNRIVRTALRINPDVDAGSGAKISTGRAEDKFGVSFEEVPAVFAAAANTPGIGMVGLDMHIGSQVSKLDPFYAAFAKLRMLADRLTGEGYIIEVIDLGGGIAVRYHRGPPLLPSLEGYAALVERHFGDANCTLVFEPGRMIAANAGVLLSRVLFVKESAGLPVLVLDAGMNDLLRPALYGAHHEIVPLHRPPSDQALVEYDVVGPVCESGDRFARPCSLPPLGPGDLVAFRGVGAYGAAMASEYNSRPRVAEVLVSGAEFALTRDRGTYAEMLARERVPGWLADAVAESNGHKPVAKR